MVDAFTTYPTEIKLLIIIGVNEPPQFPDLKLQRCRADAVAQSGRTWLSAHGTDVVGPNAGHVAAGNHGKSPVVPKTVCLCVLSVSFGQ